MRIKDLRDEIENLTKKLNVLEKENSLLNVKNKSFCSELDKLNSDYNQLGLNLQTANNVRLKAEENLEDLNKQYRTVKDAFVERD